MPPTDFEEFVRRLRGIEAMGFVETHRAGNTGIGKTLEDLLDIEENNVPGPDAAGVELKSMRRGSGSMTTLFTKEPPRDSRRLWGEELVRRLGYEDDEGRQALKVTMVADEPNNRGFFLDYASDAVEVVHESYGRCATYPLGYLRGTFEEKLPALVLVTADTREIDGREHFHYDEAYLLDGFDGDAFVELMRESVVRVDFRMHLKGSGRNRNRGTAWRITDESELERAFESRVPLLDGDVDVEPAPDRQRSITEYTDERG